MIETHIDLVPCYSDRGLFLRLAKDYVETLAQYDPTIVWDETTWSGAIWDARFIVEDRTIQGFIITEEMKFKVYNDLLYIEEFYIVPEARNRGVGLAAIEATIEHWSGDVFLYILEHNFAAKGFWTAVERKLGWKRIERPELREERGCELCAFSIS